MSGESSNEVTLTFTTEGGDRLAGASVAVYLDRYTGRSKDSAPLVASGTTTTEGRFTFSPTEIPAVVEQTRLQLRKLRTFQPWL